MSNAPEPDRSAGESGSEPAGERSADPGEERTESYPWCLTTPKPRPW